MVKGAMALSIQLILGGARSGKSSFALAQGDEDTFRSRVFLATASPGDAEMKERIIRHQQERGDGWTTIEEPYYLSRTLVKVITDDGSLVVLDCATLWISNLLCGMGGKSLSMAEAEKNISELFNTLPSLKGTLRIVSNEVGLGVVPEHTLGRQFRDLQGFFNQKMAKTAHQVFLITAGIPQKLK